MVKHIVMWKLDEKYSNAEKQKVAETFKSDLEALNDLMDGVIKINVIIQPLTSSNVDIMLESEFDNKYVLDAYQAHSKHMKVASYLKGKVVSRNCMDYEIES